jgi:hypothetical protein
MIHSQSQPIFKPNICQNFSGQSIPSEPKSEYLPSPSVKSVPFNLDGKDRLKKLLDQVDAELQEVQSKKYNYYEPDLFISIYKIKEIENEFNLCFNWTYAELIQKHPELKEINNRIANIFLKKEVADWMVKFVERIPFCYFSGNYEAEEVYTTISGVKFTTDFWNKTYDDKTLKDLCDKAFKWEDISDDWPGPSWCAKRELDVENPKIPKFIPKSHWWWGIPEEFVDYTYYLD